MVTGEKRSLVVRLAERLNVLSKGKVAQAFRAAATAEDDDPRATEYRRLSSTNRDMAPLTYEKAQRSSFVQWQRNPLARRLIQILVDFCTGDDFAVDIRIMKRVDNGPDVDTENEAGQQAWDDFVRHPVNQVDEDLPIFVQDLLVNGELVLPVTVNSPKSVLDGELGDGKVLLGYIDPLNIKEVITSPDNIRIVEKLSLKTTDSTPLYKTVVRVDTDPNSPTYMRMTGECIYWRINRTVNQTRGIGMLVDLLDWVDALDQFLFDALMGFRLRNAFFWDITMIGATQEEVDAMAKVITPPTTGRARVHNDKMTYDVKAPTLGTQDVERALLAFETFIVGTKGFPAMWFGSGADANRATASEMGIPTMRMLKATQKIIRNLCKYIAQFVLDQAAIAGVIEMGKDEYFDISISMYDFERKDAAMIGAGFQQLVTALQVAVQNGWVSNETAKKLVDGLVGRLGVDVDPNESVEENKEETQQEEDEAAYDDTDSVGKLLNEKPVMEN